LGVPGVDADRVTAWLVDRADVAPPLRYTLIPAGGSNLTVRVDDDAGRTWALRRPPVTAVLATAHDVEREWRILDALGRDGAVPVPRVVAHCGDDAVTGAPFYVMGFVDGTILRTVDDAARLPAATARAAAGSLVDVQVAIHAVDPDAAGLGELARHRTGYIERQLHRWRTQVARAQVRDLPLLDELHRRLAATVPPSSGPPALVHGDYRFDNTVLGADGPIVAVLDWELATIGDPLVDVGYLLASYPVEGDMLTPTGAMSTAVLEQGYPTREELAQRYASATGLDLGNLRWYAAMVLWKLAILYEYGRRRATRPHGDPYYADPAHVRSFLDAAHEAAGLNRQASRTD